jgi:L-seryl-tRNA(Ser) seleniumtransferase
LIQKIEKDPLMRAFRLDKMTLAALEATLRLYLHEERALATIPVLGMLTTPRAALRQRADALAERLARVAGVASVQVSDDVAFVGGGSLPDQHMPTVVLEVQASELSDAELAYRLRTGDPSVVGRVRNEKLVLDVRTIFPHQEDALIGAVGQALEGTAAP